MNKEDIIKEIQRLALENNGKPPGIRKFTTLTGISKSEWYPDYWLRWSDAIDEAGYSPNKYDTAYDSLFLIKKYIELIRELGHFPIDGELRIKRKSDSTFPSDGAFSRLGLKQERIQKIIDFCNRSGGFEDVIGLCPIIPKDKIEVNDDDETYSNVGFVYLIRHGSRNEYKIGRTMNPIRREGEIRLELPEKIEPIHYIKTDDSAGIEKYWHSRFSSKRKEGEWFSLSKEDVRAFRRWKRIF